MAEQDETIHAEVLSRLGDLTKAFVSLEVTSRTEMKGLRSDFEDLKDSLKDVSKTQSNLDSRLTAVEIRNMNNQEDRVTLAKLETRISVLANTVEHHAPVRTPWTAIVSSVVALSALLWTLFGR